MARSMDSILADEPSVETLPDTDADMSAESVSDESSTDGVTPSEAKTAPGKDSNAASAKPATKTDDDADNEDDLTDYSVAGLRKALTAARGDKRKMRKSWQEAERRLAQLEGHLSARQQMEARQHQPRAEQPAAPQIPDFYEDPIAHVTARERAIREEVERREVMQRANISEALMQEQNADYEEAKAAFMRAAAKDQSLLQKVFADPMPARVVYREGKRMLNGGASEGELKLRTEVEELRAKLAQLEGSRTPADRPAIPKSIAGARGSGNGATQAWNGPRPLDDLFT